MISQRKLMVSAAVLSAMLALGGTTAPAFAAIKLPASEVPSLAPLIQRVTPAVVSVAVKKSVATASAEGLDNPLLRQFFGDQQPQRPQRRDAMAAGSGVIVDAKNGYLLTNNHVIEDAKEITVTLKDRREVPAKVLGADKETDIALLQIKADDLSAIPIGDSRDLRVGDYVVAVGNPFGLGQTVTTGVVSALGRSGMGIEGYEDFIQTDASINPGNSGGALVDLRGQLIGINTAILGPNGNIGIGFAVPTAMAKAVMDQIVATGSVNRGQIGVQIANMTPTLAANLKVSENSGALIERVEADSAAAKAGLKAGDIVLAVNHQAIAGASDLRNRIGLMPVGTAVDLGILRQGEKMSVSLKVAPKPDQEKAVASADIDERETLHGASFAPNESHKGVVVTGVERDSPAWQMGLRPNDVIAAVNREPVNDVKALNDALKGSPQAALFIRRGGETVVVIA